MTQNQKGGGRGKVGMGTRNCSHQLCSQWSAWGGWEKYNFLYGPLSGQWEKLSVFGLKLNVRCCHGDD